MNLGPVVRPGRARAHASNLFIPTTRLWAALKSRLLLGQAGFGSRNLPEISPKHRITDLYAWTLGLSFGQSFWTGPQAPSAQQSPRRTGLYEVDQFTSKKILAGPSPPAPARIAPG